MIYKYYSEPEFKTKVNFNDLHLCLQENKKLYSDIHGIDQFIDNWEKVFYDTYKKEENIYFEFTNIENFCEVILMRNSEIRIHFAVSEAKKLLKSYPIQKIPLTAFSDYDNGHSTIKYTIVPLNKTYQPIGNPIITVPFQFDGLLYLTIDGNHRITKYKEMHKDSIDAVLLKLHDIIPLIKSNFEIAIYLFLYEGSDISHFINDSATKYYSNGIFYL